MIVADILLIVVSLSALIFATITDLRIKEVPDWVSYALISSGIAIRALAALLYNDSWYLLYGIIGFFSMFVLGSLLYYTKQWGGGDAKLLMGLGATLATAPFYLEISRIPFLVTLFVFIMLSGACYGLLWSLSYIYRDKKRFKEECKKINNLYSLKIFKIFSVIFTFLFIVLIFFLPSPFLPLLIFLSFITLCYPFLFLAVKAIENIYLYTFFPVDRLMEGDWIAEDIKVRNKIIFYKKTAITKNDIQKLKELGVKKVLVKDGIPFVPSFLIGTLLALFFGNPLV